MEMVIFPRMAHLLKNFVEIRLDTDSSRDEEVQRLRDSYVAYQKRLTGSVTRPIYVVLNPADPETVLDRFDGSDITGKRFERFLSRNVP